MRLFIAVNFTDEFKRTLLDYQKELKKITAPHTRPNWSRPENLHLTLAFIGEYDDPERVKNALEDVDFDKFTIKTHGGGHFGSLWWVGLENGERAVTLSERIRASLRKHAIPFDDKPMKPHITVVREFKSAENTHIPSPEPAEMTVAKFSLMKSERINGRLTYTEIWCSNSKQERENGRKNL